MKKATALLIFVLPLFLFAQTNSYQGIKWTENLSWDQIKAKAKKENKFIFVDCYATWCGPCKKMDTEIYSDKNIAKKIDEQFISVKVQMDSTKSDSPNIRQWYSDAKIINQTYEIIAYPSFLFFSSEGKLLHKDFGFKNINTFLELINIATDPDKQYYTLLENYIKGEKDYSLMPSLAQMAKKLKQTDQAIEIAQDYLNNYLYKKSKKALLTKDNITFMRLFVQSSKERGFRFFYNNSKKIDELIGGKNYSNSLIDYITTKEEITPYLYQADIAKLDEPEWKLMSDNISRKYKSDVAFRTIINAKIKWYTYKKEWTKLAKTYNEKFNKIGVDTAGLGKTVINNICWDVFFLKNNDIADLNQAIDWMQLVIKSNPYDASRIDTYANLLYKAGRVTEAIKLEIIAAKLAPESKEIIGALEKMKNAEPTYIDAGAIWDDNTLPKARKKQL